MSQIKGGAVPSVVLEEDRVEGYIPHDLGDRQFGDAAVRAPQPLTGGDQIEIQSNEQPEQRIMVVFGDLGERVVKQDEAGDARCMSPMSVRSAQCVVDAAPAANRAVRDPFFRPRTACLRRSLTSLLPVGSASPTAHAISVVERVGDELS